MGNQPQVRVERAQEHLKPALRQMLNEHVTELAALEGAAVEKDEDGNVRYDWLDHYWREPTRIPLAIWHRSSLAGFCLLSDRGSYWSIAEFYVAPAFRGQGIGSAAVSAIKALCRTYGRHDILYAGTQRWNPVAVSFWRAQGFVTVEEEGVYMRNEYRLADRVPTDKH